MPERRAYDLVVYKVPRRDKNGKDITGDKVGAGGRHRGDGTYSGVAYDPEIGRASCRERVWSRV